MKKKHLPHPLLWLLCLALSASCNKEVDAVSLPPFSVFPNPFTSMVLVRLDPNIPTVEPVRFRILDGRDQTIGQVPDAAPGSTFSFDLSAREKAVYYAELTVGDEIFITPIIKAE